ncbi:MAG: hypothetical protein AABZ39_06355 [Spirochaetota bacterium]
MPSFTVPLTEAGPVFDVVLSPTVFLTEKRRASGLDVYSEHVTALIDTGASQSVMSADLEFIHQLAPAGNVLIATPAAPAVDCFEYAVLITFPANVQIESRLIAVPHLKHDVQCLIGRDILRHGVFTYDGRSKSITVRF